MVSYALFWALFAGLANAETVDIQGPLTDAIRSHVADSKSVSIDSVDVASVGLIAQHSCVSTPTVFVESLAGEQFRGVTRLRISLTNDGVECGRYTISPKIILYQEVPVAAADTAPGSVVVLATRRMKVSDLRGALVDPTDGPFVAVQALRSGDPVSYRRVKRQPTANVGETVSIVVSAHGITIRAEGRLLGDAHLGDSVHVANLATNTVVQGTLIAPNTVLTGGRR